MLLKLLEELAASFQALQLNFEKHCRASRTRPAQFPDSGTGTDPPKDTDDIPSRKNIFF